MSQLTPARKLFDLLVSRDFDPEMLDVSGKPAPDPAEAEIFSFDFRAQSGKDYGTVVIMLSNEGDLEVYCADNVGKTMEGSDKTEWFAFLEQLKNFAVRNNRMNFGIKNLNHLRYSMQGQAAIKEGLFESWSGKKDVSYNAGATESRLMIKHKRSLGEDEARFRYVESLFIETAEGERYKLPFKNLTAGKAMLEHVRNGGRPYDPRGQHIAEMVTELTVLSRFRRANNGKLLEGDTAQLVEQTNAYYETLQHNLKSLTSPRGYAAYFESWAPADITEESVVIEGLKHLFVTQSIDQRIEDALPLIARIQQQGTAMKEANIFETWADRLVEGTWQTPDTPEKQAELLELMSTDLPVGADATNATEQLYNLLGDDHLFDQLQELAERDANADARQVILDRMQELSNDPDVRRVIEQLNIDATAEMNPPEATNPADLEPQDPVQEGELDDGDSIGGDKADALIRDVSVPQRDLAEDSLQSIRRAAGLLTEEEIKENVLTDDTGSTFQHILDTFKRDVKDFKETGEVSKHLHNALYDYYRDDMPYGTHKADDGDPHEWVADRFGSDLGLPGYGSNSPGVPDEDYGIERESVMHGDYAEEKSRMRELAGLPQETDEGILGTVGGAMGGGMLGTLAGGALGGALGGPAGAALGATAGGEIGRAAGAVGGQELTKGGSGIIEDDKKDKDSSVGPALAGAALGGAAGYTAAGGDVIGDIGKLFKDTNVPKPTPAEIASGTNPMGDIAGSVFEKDETDEGIVDTLKGLAGIKSTPKEPGGIFANKNPTVGSQSMPAMSTADLSKTLDTSVSKTMPGFSNSMIEDEMDEDELGTAIGAGLGGAVGGIPGAALGGIAGHYLTKDKPKTPPLNVKPSSGPYKPNSQETDEGWKGQLAGGLAGTVGGGMAGAALGGPIGAMIGSAAGGGAGGLLGDKLGGPEENEKEETDEGELGTAIGAGLGGTVGGLPGAALGGIAGHYLSKDDDKKQTKEGVRGALAGGALGGVATRSVKGAVAGAKLGSAIQDRFAKKDDSSLLAGQYGHSGKMQEVGKDTSFLDRLKELSGLKK